MFWDDWRDLTKGSLAWRASHWVDEDDREEA